MSEGSHLFSDVRYRAVRAVLDGIPMLDVAAAFGVDRTTLYRWMQKYDAEGESGLQRRTGSGRRRKLEELSEDELRCLVLKGAIHFGYETDLWTVGRLRRVITEEFSVELSKNTVWRRLRDAGLTYQKPEREYYEIDEASRKKWIRYEVPKIRRCVKKTSRNPVFPGRIEYFSDGIPRQDLVALRGDAQDESNWPPSWRRSHIGNQWTGAFAFSLGRQTNSVSRSH